MVCQALPRSGNCWYGQGLTSKLLSKILARSKKNLRSFLIMRPPGTRRSMSSTWEMQRRLCSSTMASRNRSGQPWYLASIREKLQLPNPFCLSFFSVIYLVIGGPYLSFDSLIEAPPKAKAKGKAKAAAVAPAEAGKD